MSEPPTQQTPAQDQAVAAERAAGAVDPVGVSEGGPAAAGLGAAVGRGVAWSVLATVIAKSLSFVSQIVLGLYLSKGDFGVYAIAMSAASFAFAFRDGGLWNVLVSRGPREFETIAGPIYWMGVATSTAVGALLACAAPFIADAYGDPRLTWLIVVIAASWPLSSPTWVMRTRLMIELRFREYTTLNTITAFVRYGSMIAFAIAGLGPLSFVLPLLAAAVSDGIVGYWLTRDRSWKRAPRVDLWRGLLSQSAWCIVGTLANAALEMGIYLVMGAIVPGAEVGVYYFAYQLVAQTGALLATNVQNVLFPAMSRIQDEPARRREAALRSLRALMLISAPASIALGVVFAPAESIIWRGRWADAYWPVLILAGAYPLRAVFAVPQVIEMSRGGFRQSSLMTLFTGAGIMAATGVAAALAPHATSVAGVNGVYLVAVCLFWCVWTLRGLGVGAGAVLRATVPAWLIAVGAGVLGVWTERRLAVSISSIPRAIVAAGVFGGTFTLGVRAVLSQDLGDVLRAMPLGLGPRIGRWLHMRLA